MCKLVESLPPLPVRLENSHKGTFGTSLIIGGSRGMAGAIALAGISALRSGSGLVFVACPESILPIVAAYQPSYLTVELHEDSQGQLSEVCLDRLEAQLEKCSAAGIGPGLGNSDRIDKLIRNLYTKTKQPLVVDADALNSLARQPEIISKHSGSRILTPHPGEMARLIQRSTGKVQENREAVAQEFAQQHNCVLILKGHHTIVCDQSEMYINKTGNSGLATGGSGDVLTGLIVSLLAQGMQPFEAAQLAVFLHGRAGDLAADKFGQHGLIASDLPNYVAIAMKEREQ